VIWKIALKNFFRQGTRAFLNILVTALTMIAVVFNLSLYNGFIAQAKRNMVRTDSAGGQYRAPNFDILMPTEWEDRTLPIPDSLKQLDSKDKAEVLILQGEIYPRRRLFPVQLRGLDMNQSLLDLPMDQLKNEDPRVKDGVPVILGTKMAKRAHLKTGDIVVLKWRDKFGAVDALDARVVDVVPLVNPRIDEGVVWMRLDHLRTLTQRLDEVTWVAVRDYQGSVESMDFLDVDHLMEDILNMIEQDRRYAFILWLILIFLAGISVFNTQFLNIFKRQKEIGTLMALGMTPQKIVRVFTLEGSLAAVGAVIVALVLGTGIFAWFQSVGLDVSHLSESQIPIHEKILLDIKPMEVVSSMLTIVLIMIWVAWMPVKRISKVDPTLALRGKGIT